MLRELLAERTFDVRLADDVRQFREWLERPLAQWERDPLFRQRVVVRDLRREHPEMERLERRYRDALAKGDATAEAGRLRRLERECVGAHKAIAGLGRALETYAPETHERLGKRLEHYRGRLEALERERRRLLRACAECREARTAYRELESARAGTGLAEAELALSALLTERGRRSSMAGESFERVARGLVERMIVPEVAGGDDPARILERVRLGAARVELDLVVARGARGDDPGRAVEVLAIVEAKRNINDLAHGLRLRRENIAWLTGAASGYDPVLYRSRGFPEGRFDRPAHHPAPEGELLFDPSSFIRFEGGTVKGLYLITHDGPIWGMSSAALARLSWRIATDTRIDLGAAASLERLRVLARSLAGIEETPEVLAGACRSEQSAGQIIVALAGRDDSFL